MTTAITQTLRARVVLPIGQPPIENGAVLIAGDQVAAVGPWRRLAARAGDAVLDLGERALLPGLVNAHCHLDYTRMAGMIPPPQSFTTWIKSITALKASWSYSDFAASWIEGARMLLRGGVTTVGDVEAVPELLPEVWTATPLRVISFLEMTGVKSRREPALIVSEARRLAESLDRHHDRTGLSPHAPYSTTPELLRAVAGLARHQNWRVTTHVAESEEEFQMFRHARGPLHEWLSRNERDMSDCGGVSPVKHLANQGLLGNHLLAVHANHLDPGDAEVLARHGTGVAHCPRSHAYFDHRPFPFRSLLRAGVNLCLGTDSLATTLPARDGSLHLDLREEMRVFAARNPGVSPERILAMATRNGARALGLSGHAGELAPHAFADLICVSWSGPVEQVVEAVVRDSSAVAGVMLGGHWVHPPWETQS